MNIESHIALAQKGNKKAQLALYTFLHGELKSVAMRYASDQQQASGWVNEAMFKVLSNLESLKEHAKLKPWAKAIQYQVIFADHRKRGKQKEAEIQTDQTDLHAFHHIHVDHETEYDYEFLLQLIRTLPPTTQIVFNLFAIDGYSHAEIAKQLEISVGTSKWHVSEARKRLQTSLTQQSKLYSHG